MGNPKDGLGAPEQGNCEIQTLAALIAPDAVAGAIMSSVEQTVDAVLPVSKEAHAGADHHRRNGQLLRSRVSRASSCMFATAVLILIGGVFVTGRPVMGVGRPLRSHAATVPAAPASYGGVYAPPVYGGYPQGPPAPRDKRSTIAPAGVSSFRRRVRGSHRRRAHAHSPSRMSHEAEDATWLPPFAIKPGIRVRGRGMRLVTALLVVEIPLAVAPWKARDLGMTQNGCEELGSDIGAEKPQLVRLAAF
jgi:hypothetical protein